MSTIVSGFENVPETLATTDLSQITDPDVKASVIDNAIRRINNVYGDLSSRGRDVPTVTADLITRDQLVEHLRAVAGQLLAAELKRNPDGVYDGMPATTLAKMIFYVNPGVFSGLPFAPNAVTPEDVAAVIA